MICISWCPSLFLYKPPLPLITFTFGDNGSPSTHLLLPLPHPLSSTLLGPIWDPFPLPCRDPFAPCKRSIINPPLLPPLLQCYTLALLPVEPFSCPHSFKSYSLTLLPIEPFSWTLLLTPTPDPFSWLLLLTPTPDPNSWPQLLTQTPDSNSSQ